MLRALRGWLYVLMATLAVGCAAAPGGVPCGATTCPSGQVCCTACNGVQTCGPGCPGVECPVRDSGTDGAPADGAETDVLIGMDAAPFDAPPAACGSQTCGLNQVCVQPCSGVPLEGGGPMPYCADIPAACTGAPNCDCLALPQCPSSTPRPGGFPSCMQRGPRQFACVGCA